MKVVPGFFRKQLFQISFRLDDGLSIRKSPTLGETMNVSVNRKGGYSECLGHHYAGRLVSNAGKRFKLFERLRNLTIVNIHDQR